MRIFGFFITTGAERDREKAEGLQAHIDECEHHRQLYVELQRQIEELDMQRGWWRMRFEQLEARAGKLTILPKQSWLRNAADLEITAGAQRVTIRPHVKFGLEIEVDR